MSRLILDSGAYSAWTKGKPIDLDAYTRWVCKHQDKWYAAVNLDHISPKDPEAGAAQGWANYEHMRAAGAKVVPVYHIHEHRRWLDKMLDTSDYIGLSATSLDARPQQRQWMDLIWNYATDSTGAPVARFHAFGDGSEETLATYPWHSCDCASAQLIAGLTGSIVIGRNYYQILTTSRRSHHCIALDDHPEKLEAVRTEVMRRGINFDEFMKDDLRPNEKIMIKYYLNCVHFLELRDKVSGMERYNKARGLLRTPNARPGTPRTDGLKFFFVATDPLMDWGFPVFAALGISDLLVSYFYMKRWPMLFEFMNDPIAVASRSRYWPILNRFLLEPIKA